MGLKSVATTLQFLFGTAWRDCGASPERSPVCSPAHVPSDGGRRLSRHQAHIVNVRRRFLHEVSSQLIQTHDRLCLEDLAVANLMTNRYLARAIADAAWAEFARQLV